MFEAHLLDGRVIVTAPGPWDQVGPVQVDGHDLRTHLAFLDWMENEAAGRFGHLVGSRKQARPSDLAVAIQAAAHRWQPVIVRSDVQPVDPHLPAGAVN